MSGPQGPNCSSQKTPLMTTPAPSALAHQDPFYTARDDLKGKVDYIQTRHEKFLELLKTSNTAANSQFKELRRTLYRDIELAEGQARELEKTVSMVEANRQRFRHIDNLELAERRAFVTHIKQMLVKVWNNLESEHVKGKIAADEREYQRGRGGAPAVDSRVSARETENSAFIDEQRSRTQMLMKSQDEGLVELDKVVTNVGRMAGAINEELQLQNRMLTELEQEVDDTNERMNFVMGKLGKLLKTKDKCQLWTIVILCVVLIILVFLVIYV